MKYLLMYNIEISKLAYNEIEESKEYYNLQKDNFGLDFKSDVFKVLKYENFMGHYLAGISG